MTEAEIQKHLRAALESHLPKVVDDTFKKICAEQSTVMEHARVESDAQHQVEQLKKDKREGRLWRYVIAPLVVAALGGSGVGIYQNNATEATVDGRVDDLEEAIVGCANGDDCEPAKQKESLSGRVQANEKKIDRLGELHFQQLRVIVDQGEEQRQKLNTMSPEAKAIPVPDSANDARTAVEAHEKLKEEKEEKKRAEEAIKKGDPFAGIE